MRPKQPFSYFINSILRNFQLLGKNNLKTTVMRKFRETFYVSHSSLVKFCHSMIFSPSFTQNSRKVKIVLSKCNVFKVLKSVIRFNSVNVVGTHSIRFLRHKFFKDKIMGIFVGFFTVHIKSIEKILVDSFLWFKNLSYSCFPGSFRFKVSSFKSSEIAYCISAIRPRNWFPNLIFHSLIILVLLCYVNVKDGFSGTVSFDQVAVSADITVSNYNLHLDRIYREFNSNTQASNIANDTLTESTMADEINPRVRTFEGASCEFVFSGLLPVTTSGTLVMTTPSGVAYPRGFRVNSSGDGGNTYTATRWTYVDLDQAGAFTYSEIAIEGTTPAIATNSIRLGRVSTDATEVTNILDLRIVSCAAGPFNAIADTTSEASLHDLLHNGRPIRNRGTKGFLQGMHVSWDTTTTFIVTGGSAWINEHYRSVSGDTSVPQTNDSPGSGTSGLDTGAIAAGRYNVFAVADQTEVKTFSISYSTGTSPTGVTNSRLIGEIVVSSDNTFTSTDIVRTHGIAENELIAGSVHFEGVGAMLINKSRNVAAVSREGSVGEYTITWDQDFDSISYAVAGYCQDLSTETQFQSGTSASDHFTVGTTRVGCNVNNAGLTDSDSVSVIAIGDLI